MNRTAGSIADFIDSELFRKIAELRRLHWTEADLDELITDPDWSIPGIKMPETKGGGFALSHCGTT